MKSPADFSKGLLLHVTWGSASMTEKSCPQLPFNACLTVCTGAGVSGRLLQHCLSFTRRTWYRFIAHHRLQRVGESSIYFYCKSIYFSFIFPRYAGVSYNLPFLSSVSLICSAISFILFLPSPWLTLIYQPVLLSHTVRTNRTLAPLPLSFLPHTLDLVFGL